MAAAALLGIGLLFGASPMHAGDAEHEHEAEAEAAPAGPGLLQLTPARQAGIDLRFTELQRLPRQISVPVRAEVLDPAPLIELALLHAALRAEQRTAEAELRAATATVQRLERLRTQGENATLRELDAARVRAATAAATRDSAALRRQLILAQARLDWGEAAPASLEEQSGPLEPVIRGEARLLRVESPVGARPPERLTLAASGLLPGLPEAELLGPAPRLAGPLPIQAWLYLVDDASLPLGRRLVDLAWPAEALPQLLVAPSAIVWFGGQAWVWRDEGSGAFRRLPVAVQPADLRGERVVIEGPLDAGDRIVIQGAGQLLGEEFAAVIPGEDDD